VVAIELSNYRTAVAILFITLLTFLPGIGIFASISKISSTLDVELVFEGITKPADIEFLSDEDISVLEKNKATLSSLLYLAYRNFGSPYRIGI